METGPGTGTGTGGERERGNEVSGGGGVICAVGRWEIGDRKGKWRVAEVRVEKAERAANQLTPLTICVKGSYG